MKKINGFVVLVAAFTLMFVIVSCNSNADEPEKKEIAVAEISLNKTELTLTAGGKETLTATVKPDNATDKTVTWTSNKTDIATVSANGEVTAIAKGSATIKATAGGKSATCTVTVNPVMYSVTVTGGTANPAAAEAGATVTITANTPESGKEFDSWTTEISVTFADANAPETTFTMPASTVTVTATYKDEIPAETKLKPTAVGDIVLADGTAVAYENLNKMSSSQKASAIAIIFYVGTGLNSGDDTTTSRTLGVGLKHKYGIAWCTDSANASNMDITTIQCKVTGKKQNLEFVDENANDRNGSNNLKQIAEFLTAADGATDDTSSAEKYPAFYFAKNYKDVEGSNVSGTDYENGWYLPSLAELFQIYANGKGTDKLFDLDAISDTLGGDKFQLQNTMYWSSSQCANYGAIYAHVLIFYEGRWNSATKTVGNQRATCCIREF